MIYKQVSFPGNRVQELYPETFVDLFSQGGHSGIECVVDDRRFPNFAKDFFPRYDPILILQQEFQQLKFPELQRKFSAITPDFTRVTIQYKARRCQLLTAVTGRGINTLTHKVVFG